MRPSILAARVPANLIEALVDHPAKIWALRALLFSLNVVASHLDPTLLVPYVALRVAPSATFHHLSATMLPISALSALLAATLSIELANAHGAHKAYLHRRQAALAASSSSSAAPAPSGTTSAAAATSAAATTAAYVGTGSYNVPPLASISSGMPTGPTPVLTASYTAGAVPTYSGAPPLPSACTCISCIIIEWLSLTRIGYRSRIQRSKLASFGCDSAH